MKFYKVNFEYMLFLSTIDNKIIHSKSVMGIPLRMNELIYFLPYQKPDDTDKDLSGKIKKSQPTIFRLFDANNNEYYGKLLLSNMFAVPYNSLEPLDYLQYSKEEIILMDKILNYIKINKERITKAALRLLKQKAKHYQQAYLDSTVDFSIIEEASISWEVKHYGKHINRFPDQHFFLTNPKTSGIGHYFLMNKTTKISEVCYDHTNHKIISVPEIFDIAYAPFECFKKDNLDPNEMTKWFRGRGIPSWRDGLDDLLENLGIENKDVLLNMAYGLSLSDQYWLNPVDRPLDFNDINFFDHNFYSQDFIAASFENKILDNKKVDFYSPNNTSDGMLKKAWIVGPDKKRYLLKASFKYKGLEPFNEVLGSIICKAIGLTYVPYTIEVLDKLVLSKCECFINKNTEFISAYAILKRFINYTKLDEIDVYNKYLSILENNGITHVKEKLTKMFILDYLMVNQDRHLGNFGIIRNVNTLEWVDVATNFDTGQSMFFQNDIYKVNFKNAQGSFFTKKNVDFEKILNIVLNDYTFNIDFDALRKIPQQYEELLLRYQHLSLLDKQQIDMLVKGLRQRIDLLETNIINYL